MNRRQFLAETVAAAAAAALTAGTLARAEAASAGTGETAPPAQESAGAPQTIERVEGTAGSGFYTPNRPPLQPTAFLKLPPGSIEPRGWLKHQLELQLDGLNGRMTEVSDYLDYDQCGWVHPQKKGWEELPYWLRGFGDLGYVTGDARVQALTRKWIDGILATQQGDGMFGPVALRTSLEGGPDFWPGMPLLDAMRSYQEYSGDARIVPFMTNYFAFQNKQPAEVFGRSWASYRWGDTIDSILWLYNRTGDGWLLDLTRKVHAHGADYTNSLPTLHNVNVAQGFREPAQFGVLAGERRFRDATYRAYATVMNLFGQFPGGGFAGDENCRIGHTDPRQGFETCGIVEFMHSFELLTRITGDPVWADRCEQIAFNNMPAAFDPQQKGTHYITAPNCVTLDNTAKTRGQFDNNWPMLAYMPGVHNYRCCPHNYGMGWPYYAQELWLATTDGGLCASLYAASTVRAKVGNGGRGDGVMVSIASATDYPFRDAVELTVSTPQAVEFPLYLRIPAWCEGAAVTVNGTKLAVAPKAGSYAVIRRRWSDGDRVSLRLPMTTGVRRWEWNQNGVSVQRGPLTYALAIEEKWEQIGGNARWPHYAVKPMSAWNYGLPRRATAMPDGAFNLVVKDGPLPPNPWTPADAPVRLEVDAHRVPQWTCDEQQVVNALPASPCTGEGAAQRITLVPMGAARLRISVFPEVEEA